VPKTKKINAVIAKAKKAIAKADNVLASDAPETLASREAAYVFKGSRVKVRTDKKTGALLSATTVAWLDRSTPEQSENQMSALEDRVSLVANLASEEYRGKKKAQEHGAKGGRPASSYAEAWAIDFSRRRALSDHLSDSDIFKKIARDFLDEKDRPRSWTTIRNAVQAFLKLNKVV